MLTARDALFLLSLPSARSKASSVVVLENVVGHTVDALLGQAMLRPLWCETALNWALYCRSRHFSCRSFQVRA